MLFEEFQNRRERSSTAICFLSSMCLTSKSKSLIYINQRVIKTFERSATKRLSCVIKIFASISMINYISYNQKRIFFNAFRSSRHFRFIASYRNFDLIYNSLSYRERCRLLISKLICKKITFYFFKLKFTVNIISSVKKK